MTTWATVDNVRTVTGVEVDDDLLTRAQAVIETVADRPASAVQVMLDSDARRLRSAVCYQAAYMNRNPDLLITGDVTSLSADDVSITFRDGTVGDGGLARLVAPLALLALAKVSWLRRKTIRVAPSRHPDADPDDIHVWTGQPLPEHVSWEPLP